MTSVRITVNVEALMPSAVTVLGLAVKVVVVLAGTPGKNVTVVCKPVLSTVAVTVLMPASVDLRVVVKIPFWSVKPLAGENVFAVPVAVIVSGANCTG